MPGVCVALVGGGIDSPVAVARMLMQGWKIFPVHASQEAVTGPAAEQKTVKLLKYFLELEGPLGDAARQNLSRELYVVPVSEKLALFTEKWNHTDTFIHMKRLFSSIATIRGQEINATHLLTGENLGQVSSQTLGNLGGIEIASPLVPLRPLLAFDKVDIMNMARMIGTLEISEGRRFAMRWAQVNQQPLQTRNGSRGQKRVGGQHLASDCYSKLRIVNLWTKRVPPEGSARWPHSPSVFYA